MGRATIPITVLTLGLAAAIVNGFRLRWGLWSALIGSTALSIVNSLTARLIGAEGNQSK